MTTREWLLSLLWSAVFWTGVVAGAAAVMCALLFVIEGALR